MLFFFLNFLSYQAHISSFFILSLSFIFHFPPQTFFLILCSFSTPSLFILSVYFSYLSPLSFILNSISCLHSSSTCVFLLLRIISSFLHSSFFSCTSFPYAAPLFFILSHFFILYFLLRDIHFSFLSPSSFLILFFARHPLFPTFFSPHSTLFLIHPFSFFFFILRLFAFSCTSFLHRIWLLPFFCLFFDICFLSSYHLLLVFTFSYFFFTEEGCDRASGKMPKDKSGLMRVSWSAYEIFSQTSYILSHALLLFLLHIIYFASFFASSLFVLSCSIVLLIFVLIIFFIIHFLFTSFFNIIHYFLSL